MSEAKKELTIGSDDLKTLIQTAIQTAMEEARKPLPPTEKEIAKIAEEQALRAQQGAQVKQYAESRRIRRQMCSHTRRDGSTKSLFVQDRLGGYMLCQGCQDRIRPELSPELRKLDAEEVTYDSNLFNKLFQASAPSIFA